MGIHYMPCLPMVRIKKTQQRENVYGLQRNWLNSERFVGFCGYVKMVEQNITSNSVFFRAYLIIIVERISLFIDIHIYMPFLKKK